MTPTTTDNAANPRILGQVVLVTGANGGIGTQFVQQALELGAAKVYATARKPRTWDDPRVVPLGLDINDPASRAAAVQAASDVTVVVNNAGTLPPTASMLDLTDAELREGMETNFFGPVAIARAFAPLLTAHEHSVLINVHSVASWYAFGGIYSASKAALWSATNSLRLELAPRGVQVIGVHVGYVDTAMAAGNTGPKLQPAELVRQVYDTVAAGGFEVIADDLTARVKAGLAGPIEALYPQVLTAQE